MADSSNNSLTVPDSNPYFQGAVSGRPRSGSQRSQRSGGILTPVAENGNGNDVLATPERPSAYDRRPSIRIRRLSTATRDFAVPGAFPFPSSTETPGEGSVGRRRSVSDPTRGGVALPRLGTQNSYMPNVVEEYLSPTTGTPREQFPAFQETIPEQSSGRPETSPAPSPQPETKTSRWRPLRRARTNIGTEKEKGKEAQAEEQNNAEYEEHLVDLLDLVDPEVSTLQTLTNVQNSLFIPDLGRYLNRRPTYNLTKRPTKADSTTSSDDDGPPTVPATDETRPPMTRLESGATLNTISSNVNDRYYAVLPHGVRLPNWSEEEKLELNDHVRHMLHSRRSKFKRSMKGFKQYVSKPLGFFVTFYAVSITAFGLAWVLFLIGWINVGGSREDYLVNIIDNVLVALFAVMGDGLAPFRAVDTYHMCFIAHYHHLTWRLRREKSLPKLQNNSDLPAIQPDQVQDVEKQEFSVLNPKQVEKLAHHQKKFAKSHSFYKPHETSTHYAFPLRLLVAIVVLLDCHSLLQIALGTCTWAISYHVRPFALTTVILCCSITVNITAGILITIGDHKTRKKDVREKMIRQDLTADAIKLVEKKRRHELKKAGLIKDGEKKESALDSAKREEAGEELVEDNVTTVPAAEPEIVAEGSTLRAVDPGADSFVRR